MKDTVPFSRQCLFAFRLAWRQMLFHRAKLLAAVSGVMFACVLVFFQTGFKDALWASVLVSPSKMSGDLFLVHRQTEAFWRSIPFAESTLHRMMSHPDAQEVISLYMGFAPFKNPVTQQKRTIFVYGYDLATDLLAIPDVLRQKDTLKNADTVLFDRASRPEFGPIADLVAQKVAVDTELNDRRVSVQGIFTLGGSFSADGNVIVGETNFFRLFPGRTPEYIDLGIVRLKKGADIKAAQASLRTILDQDVYLFTAKEMQDHELGYWKESVPIGFIFDFGTLMGLIVGMVIVYQILFTDVMNNIPQYATLSAMGYPFRYFMLVVFSSSLILAVLGFVPGVLVSSLLYNVAESNIYLPMPMPLSKIIGIFLLTLGMCIASGFLAMQKLRRIDPAEMF